MVAGDLDQSITAVVGTRRLNIGDSGFLHKLVGIEGA
jgi:hypothetical protein